MRWCAANAIGLILLNRAGCSVLMNVIHVGLVAAQQVREICVEAELKKPKGACNAEILVGMT